MPLCFSSNLFDVFFSCNAYIYSFALEHGTNETSDKKYTYTHKPNIVCVIKLGRKQWHAHGKKFTAKQINGMWSELGSYLMVVHWKFFKNSSYTWQDYRATIAKRFSFFVSFYMPTTLVSILRHFMAQQQSKTLSRTPFARLHFLTKQTVLYAWIHLCIYRLYLLNVCACSPISSTSTKGKDTWKLILLL